MKKSAEKQYLVTMRVVVRAKSEDAALNKLDKAGDKALKVAVSGVELDVEEAPDE